MTERTSPQELLSPTDALRKELPETADVEKTMGHYHQEIAALNSFSRAVAAGKSPEKVAKDALREIEKIAAPDLTFVLEQKNGELLPLAMRFNSKRIEDFPLAKHWPGACLCGLACGGEAVFSRNIREDARCTLDECKQQGIRSFAALPLIIDEELLGVLALASLTDRDFSRNAVFLEALASQLAIGLKNAWLFENLQQTNVGLRKSEELYRSLVENIDLGVTLIDEDHNILMVNDAQARFFEKDAGSFVGRKCFREFERRGKICPHCPGVIAVKTGEPQEIVTEGVREDGSLATVRIKAFPVAGEDGGKKRFIEIVEDITERVRREKLLEKHESLLNSIFRSAPVGIGLTVDRVLKWSNIKLSEITGYTAGELQDQSSRILYTDDVEFERVRREKHAQIGQYGTGTVETKWRRKDGALIDVLLSSTPLQPDDLSAGLTFTALDITGRKRTQEELRQAKEQWEKSFNAIEDMVTIQDTNLRIVRANETVARMFGANPEEVIGRHCHELFRGCPEPCAGCPELETLKDGQSHSHIIKHEPLGRTFLVSCSPIVEMDGRIENFVHVAKDITEKVQMEEELFQARKMEAIGTLAGGIAHDFNNILTAILGYAELARQCIDDKAMALDDLDEVITSSHRARDLVKQILTFSRKSEQQRVLLEPHLIVKESLKLLRASIPTTIEIQEEIDPHCGKVKVDPTKLQQIIVNLCTNALHAIENEQGVISVRLGRVELLTDDLKGELVAPGAYIELTVSDTGCGMDEAVLKRIFEPYFTTKAIGKGSGMGLALVHGIVHKYGGAVKVESHPGKGSVFRVFLPVVLDESGAEDAEKRELSPLPTGTERIMVVDDESSIAAMQKTLLEHQGYTVTAFTSSAEALEKFKADPEQFDLVITDQTMPQLPGTEFAQKILEVRPELPIILSTGYSSVVSEERAKALGISAFAMKPLGREQLARLVREVLERRR